VLKKILETAATISALVALTAIALFFLEARQLSRQAIASLQATQKDIHNSATMLNAVLYQVGDLAKESHDTIQAEQQYLRTESRLVILTNRKAIETLETVRSAVNQNSSALTASLTPVPAVLDQAKETLKTTEKTIADLQQTENNASQLLANLQPAATQLSATMVHVESLSAQADQEVKKLLKPTPWYKKILPGLITAMKAVAVFY
jgi:ABC-type transporter Mla subunit MlaD